MEKQEKMNFFKQFWTRSALDEFSRIMLPTDGFLCWKTHTHKHKHTAEQCEQWEDPFLSLKSRWMVKQSKNNKHNAAFCAKRFFLCKIRRKSAATWVNKTTAEFEQIMTISAVVAEFSAEYKVSYFTLFSSFPLFLSLLI